MKANNSADGSERRETKPFEAVHLVDRYWTDPEARGMRWLHVWVSARRTSNQYNGLITLGAGRGDGFSLTELAEQTTRQLEREFGMPTERMRWGIRVLAPRLPHEYLEEDDSQIVPLAAVGGGDKSEDFYLDVPVGRTDLFVVWPRAGRRIACATTSGELVRLFRGVSIPAPVAALNDPGQIPPVKPWPDLSDLADLNNL